VRRGTLGRRSRRRRYSVAQPSRGAIVTTAIIRILVDTHIFCNLKSPCSAGLSEVTVLLPLTLPGTSHVDKRLRPRLPKPRSSTPHEAENVVRATDPTLSTCGRLRDFSTRTCNGLVQGCTFLRLASTGDERRDRSAICIRRRLNASRAVKQLVTVLAHVVLPARQLCSTQSFSREISFDRRRVCSSAHKRQSSIAQSLMLFLLLRSCTGFRRALVCCLQTQRRLHAPRHWTAALQAAATHPFRGDAARLGTAVWAHCDTVPAGGATGQDSCHGRPSLPGRSR
jgi:hypothetical protein